MPEHVAPAAYLETADQNHIPILVSCSIGRAASNQIVLQSEKVSRHHASIQLQQDAQYWLMDLGSRNGTYLNGRRLAHPARLQQGDRIAVGPFEFLFQRPATQEATSSSTHLVEPTVVDVRMVDAWLLVADIVNSTNLLRNMPLSELPALTGRWVAECKRIIEQHNGRINQFLGDGFFAYWHDQAGMEPNVVKAMQALTSLQEQGHPEFRIAGHYARVALGGFSIGEEERISGEGVHFAFRLEKLAGQLGEFRLMSQAANERLKDLVRVRDAGHHILPGFNDSVQVFAF